MTEPKPTTDPEVQAADEVHAETTETTAPTATEHAAGPTPLESADDAGAPPAAAPPYVAAPAAAPPVTGPHYLSIVAFTLGLVGIISPGLPSIAAIVLGHIGLAKEPSGRTFAIIGLVAGYAIVGLFIIGTIIAIAFTGAILSAIMAAVPTITTFGP